MQTKVNRKSETEINVAMFAVDYQSLTELDLCITDRCNCKNSESESARFLCSYYRSTEGDQQALSTKNG